MDGKNYGRSFKDAAVFTADAPWNSTKETPRSKEEEATGGFGYMQTSACVPSFCLLVVPESAM